MQCAISFLSTLLFHRLGTDPAAAEPRLPSLRDVRMHLNILSAFHKGFRAVFFVGEVE